MQKGLLAFTPLDQVDKRRGKFVVQLEIFQKVRDREGGRHRRKMNRVRTAGLVELRPLQRVSEYALPDGELKEAL